MSIMSTPKAPKGFQMLQFPTRGGQSSNTYSMLSQVLPELLQQAQGAPGAFEGIEGPAQRQFEQITAPGIAQRYSGSGIGASSGMQNSLAAAGKDLSMDLASKRAGLMQQSMHNVLSLGDLLLGRPDTETMFAKKPPGFWQQMLGIGLPVAGAALGSFGGLGGAQLGAGIGSMLGRGFLN